ncbi:thiamine pyrophosphate-binding protein [Roseovarius albus]|nr:thiamine pyrophosphate-binding protein [Roseovarius albus]
MTQKRAADLLAERLYQAGCRHAFGMPGGEVLTLVDALEQAGIKFTLVKHENAAGFMAEAVWQRTGAPGIVVATIGPGAMNAVNAVANAMQERVPLIMLSGCVDADEAQQYTHQVMDHSAVFAPITKATFTLSTASAGLITDKALGIALEGRPGPVFIDVPISVADANVSNAITPHRAPAGATAPAHGVDLDRARGWLAKARKPVMIVGVDAMNERAEEALLQFANHHNVPFVTTYKAKGIIAEDHPLCLGGAGLSPLADKHLLPFIQSADLILCAGYDPIEMRTGWQNIWDPAQVNVIDISAEPNHHYMHQATLNFTCDTATGLNTLSDGIAPVQTWTAGEVSAVKDALSKAFDTSEDWGPAAVIAECQRHLPANTTATADSGAHRILLSQIWKCSEPRSLLQSSALCTMGCAVPLAIGASIVEPERISVSFSGDAGFLMIAGELASAAELELKTIFVVFVDRSLALIELKQRQRQMVNRGVDFAHHDFAAIGRAFGGQGHRVTSRVELAEALKAAQQADTFTVIAAEIERGAYDGRI